jgi:hypothetical protein
MSVSFFNPSSGNTLLAGNVAGQFKTEQYTDGSITNVKLTGGITIDKLSVFGTTGQLLQSDGSKEVPVTPPLIFSNINELSMTPGNLVKVNIGGNGYDEITPIAIVTPFLPTKVTKITLTLSVAYTFVDTHGLGTEPFNFRAVLVCNTPEYGYSAGDELVLDSTGTRGITVGYNATNVFVYTDSAVTIEIRNISTSANAPVAITLGSWYIKLYLSL